MRFHIGFSKSIKSKTILKFLVALGLLIGCRILMGFDVAHAETTWTNINFTSGFMSSPYSEALTYTSNFNDIVTPTTTLEYTTGYGYGFRFYNYSLSRVFYFPFAMTQGFANTSSRYWNSTYLFNEMSMKFQNSSSYCQNNTTDLKSINFQFPLYISTTMQNDMSVFNQTSISDMFKVRIVAQSSNNEDTLLFPTYCSVESLEPNQSAEYKWNYLVSCNNVFQGNSNYQVSDYTIQIINSIPFNDRYIDSNENKGIVIGSVIIGNSDYSTSQLVNYSMRYSCSDEPPVLDNGSGGDDDPAGYTDIYDKIREKIFADESVTGITHYLQMPQSISDLASLPLVFLQKVFENGDLTCSNYEIDLTSIANNWLGHGYNSNDYKLKLPCMRTLLNNTLGSLYTLADLLLACLVFYSVAKHIFVFVDLITEGEDLYSYYFTGGDDNSDIEGHKANAYVNHKTGEVKFK